MQRQAKQSQTLLWKKIMKENKQQLDQLSVLSEGSKKNYQHGISTLLPQVQNKNQDLNQLDQFINQIEKSGIPIDQHNDGESQINIQTHSQYQQKRQVDEQKQNNQQSITQSIVQKLNIDGDFRNGFFSFENKKQYNKISAPVLQKVKLQLIKMRRIMSLLHQQIKNIIQNFGNYKNFFVNSLGNAQIIIKQGINMRFQTNKFQQNQFLKNRIQILENKIKQKQQKIQNLCKQLQNIKAQNFQLVFDLNQKIQQADIIIQEKVKNLMQERMRKLNDFTQIKNEAIIQQLNFSNIEQKSKFKYSFNNTHQIQSKYQKGFNYKFHKAHQNRNKTNPDDSQSRQLIERKLFPQQFRVPKSKHTISIQNTQSHLSRQLNKNEDEINRKIQEIRKKYRTSKPKTPIVQANVYKNNFQLSHNKSQIICNPSTNANSSSNTLSFLNNYQNKNMIKKVGSPKTQIMVSKGFSSPSSDILTNLLNKNPQKYNSPREKQTKVDNRLQSFKIDRLGNRIDELRNQIKRQIQASK